MSIYLKSPRGRGFFIPFDPTTDANAAPVARIDLLSPSEGPAPYTVRVSALRSSDDYGIVSYLWDWGDGTFDSGVEAEHTYLIPGEKRIVLIVEDGNEGTDRAEIRVQVTGNAVPVARIVYQQAGLSFSFSAAGSSDPDGNLVAFTWEIDGVQVNAGSLLAWTAPSAGTYTVRLTVTDDGSPALSDSEIIQVVAIDNTNPSGDLETVQDRIAELALTVGPQYRLDAARAIATQQPDGTFSDLGPIPPGPSSALNNYMWNYAGAIQDITRQFLSGPYAGSITLLQVIVRALRGLRSGFTNFTGSKALGWPQYGWYVPESMGYVFNMLIAFRRANPSFSVDGVAMEDTITAIASDILDHPAGPWTQQNLTGSPSNRSASNAVYRDTAEFYLRAGIGDTAGMAALIAGIPLHYRKGAGLNRILVEGATADQWWNGLTLDGGASAHPSDGHQADAIYGNGMMRASTQVATVVKDTAYTLEAIYPFIHDLVVFLRTIVYKTKLCDFFLERYFNSWRRIPTSAPFYIEDLIAGIGDDVDPAWVAIWEATEEEFRRPRRDAVLAGSWPYWQLLMLNVREPEYSITLKHGAVDAMSNSLPLFEADAQHWPYLQCAIVQTGSPDSDVNQGDQFELSAIGQNWYGPNLSTRIASVAGMPTTARTGNYFSRNRYAACMGGPHWALIGSQKHRGQAADVSINQKTHIWIRNEVGVSYLITLTAGISLKGGGPAAQPIYTNVQDLWLEDAAVNRGLGAGVEVIATSSTVDQVISDAVNYSIYQNRVGYVLYGTHDVREQFYTRTRPLREMHEDYGSGSATARVFHLAIDHGTNPADATSEVLMILKGQPVDTQNARNTKPYTTIANTDAAQFIQVGNQLVGRFNEAGSVNALGTTISADRACALRIVNNGDGTYTVSYHDQERLYAPGVRTLALTIAGTTHNLPFGSDQNWYISGSQMLQRTETMPKPVYDVVVS